MAENRIIPAEIAPEIRKTNFDEVSTGYTENEAVEEAARCILCGLCKKGCPVAVDIPSFIKLLKEGRFIEAYEKIKEKNCLAAITGRVCPQETQCEAYCQKKNVNIGKLERFVADYYISHNGGNGQKKVLKGKKVAVIGSGPAGLTAASELAEKGLNVTLYEALHELGGVLIYGIPEFRLPKRIVSYEVEKLINLGVNIETNVLVGKTVTIDELMDEEGFEAVLITTGAGLPNFMNIPGEGLNGVYTANEFLTRVNLMKGYKFPEVSTPVDIGKTVFVVGGGNVAMDAARTAVRLGAEDVRLIYRREESDMPARLEELHHAVEEGVKICELTLPVVINGNEKGRVTSVELVKMKMVDEEVKIEGKKPRRNSVKIEGTNYTEKCDTVIIAIGQKPNPVLLSTTYGLEVTDRGTIKTVTDGGLTTKKGVYAAGDAVIGAATVIKAMGMAKKSVEEIVEYLNKLN